MIIDLKYLIFIIIIFIELLYKMDNNFGTDIETEQDLKYILPFSAIINF